MNRQIDIYLERLSWRITSLIRHLTFTAGIDLNFLACNVSSFPILCKYYEFKSYY